MPELAIADVFDHAFECHCAWSNTSLNHELCSSSNALEIDCHSNTAMQGWPTVVDLRMRRVDDGMWEERACLAVGDAGGPTCVRDAT